jgi:hypothetical protein
VILRSDSGCTFIAAIANRATDIRSPSSHELTQIRFESSIAISSRHSGFVLESKATISFEQYLPTSRFRTTSSEPRCHERDIARHPRERFEQPARPDFA